MTLAFIVSAGVGLTVGSFLNVLICRLPAQESIRGRSRCPHCTRTLEWFELIPVLSFLALKRKCRTCTRAISWQYPLVEIATALLFMGAVAVRGEEYQMLTWQAAIVILRDWVILSALIVTFVTDFTSQLIYDAVLFLAGIGVFALGMTAGLPLLPTIFGSILGASFFGLQYLISRGKWIGAGDIILGGFLGIAFAYPGIFITLALAYVAGMCAAIPLVLLRKKQWQSRIAFGTFLSLAGIITLFWGNAILNWYLHLILF